MSKRGRAWRQVRPAKSFDSTNPIPFDPRSSTFIPELSVEDIHVAEVGARKLRTFGVKVYNSNAQTVADTTDTMLAFDTEAFDEGGFFDASVDDETITVPFTGIYDVSAFVEFESDAAGFRRLTVIWDGMDDVTAAVPAPNGAPWRNVVAAPLLLEAGATIAAEVRQNSGGDLDITAGEHNNFLSVILKGHV